MFKNYKSAAFSATVVALNCVPLPVSADGPLAAPNVGGGQYGANRRVITTPNGYHAVRGNFSIPSSIKVPPFYIPGYLSDDQFINANSKPSFYLGISRKNAGLNNVETDAGIQYEWKAVTYTSNGVATILNPGWSIFAYAKFDRLNKPRFDTNPAGAWRSGIGTFNPSVSSFDLSFVVRPRVTRSPTGGVIALPRLFYAYLEVNALGATAQPIRKDINTSIEPGRNNRIVIFDEKSYDPVAGTGYDVQITDSTSEMAAKRVVAITQGGTLTSPLNFPLPYGGLYSEDGSYMRDCDFKGVDNLVAGQVALGPPIAVLPNPAWRNWSADVSSTTASVNQSNSAGGTGYYPDGVDKTLIFRSPLGPENSWTGVAAGSLPYFLFPSLPVNTPSSSEIPARYDAESVSIHLRAGVSVSGFSVTPGERTFVYN